MAYRDPTFNANLLTDLLGTYLTHNSQEREKYYKAEQQGNRPQYRTVDGNLVSIGRDGQITTLMTKKVQEKEPKFEDFSKDGNVNKGQFMGQNYISTEEDKNAGMPKGYKFVSSRPLFKPENPKKREIEIENKDIQRMIADRKTLLNRKNKNFDALDLMFIEKGIIPKNYTEEDEKRLKDIETKLAEKGFNIYGVEQSTSAPKQKTRKKITY
tara:strand:- start:3411 stop:4046 length:636 start_codon:yes stop_codon:yes gene_type:complete